MQMPKLKLSDISLKAVIVGAVADNVGTLLIMSFLAAALVSNGLSPEEAMERLRSTSGLLLGFILGMGFTVLGGYIAGWMAKRSEVLHGACVAMVGMVLALALHDDVPKWYDIAGILAMIPAGMTGGRLARLKRKGDGNEQPLR